MTRDSQKAQNEAEDVSSLDDVHAVGGFCKICWRILDNWGKFKELNKPSLYGTHYSVLGMRRSAQNGCALCALFVADAENINFCFWESDIDISGGDMETDDEHAAEIHETDTQIGEGEWFTDGRSLSDEGTIRIQLAKRAESEKSNQRSTRKLYFSIYYSPKTAHWTLCLYFFHWKEKVLSKYRFSAIEFWPVLDSGDHNTDIPSCTSPSSDELVLLAKKWIQRCDTQHKDCFQASHDCKLPTRLLRIDRQNLQLVPSTRLPYNTRYATLSHCWGSSENLKLTKSAFQAFEISIPGEKLCKTFQDAISIATKLEVEYLWIDSLCIIQDDEKDWRRESEQMSTVYGNSYVNIAAAGASDGDQGCFFQDEPTRINKLRVKARADDEEILYDLVPHFIEWFCASHTPLAKRAWALQERLLPARTLHFGRAQLLMECNEVMMCESLPYPLSIREGFLSIDKKALSNFWTAIVSIYSGCHLTKLQDKFVALSGVIRKIQTQSQDTCVAGLWKSNIENELLWWARFSPSRSNTYLAPSWSWVSVNGGTVADKGADKVDVEQLYAHVISVSVQPLGSDPLGELCGGNMSLSCQYLVGVTFLGPGPKLVIGPYQKEKIKINSKDGEFETSAAWDDKNESVADVYLVPIRGSGSDSVIKRTKVRYGRSISGLIIAPTRQEQGQYRRLGVFDSSEMRFRGGKETHELCEALLSPECAAGADAFAGFTTKNHHDGENRFINII